MAVDMVYVPAGMRTTVLAGAEVMAAFMLAAVTVPLKRVLQADVVQFGHAPDGTPPGTPAFDQS